MPWSVPDWYRAQCPPLCGFGLPKGARDDEKPVGAGTLVPVSFSLPGLQQDPTEAAFEEGAGFRCTEGPAGWGAGDPI